MTEQIRHADDCWFRGDDCIECGGCDCGLNERTCTGPGCYSIDAHSQWCSDEGIDPSESCYA